MVGLLDDLDLSLAHVVGISMGGALALHMALEFPERVDRLVLANTYSHLRPEELSGWLYFARRVFLVHTLGLPAQARYVAQRIFPQLDQEILRQELIDRISQADPRAYRAAMRSLGLFNVRGRLGEIKLPALVVTVRMTRPCQRRPRVFSLKVSLRRGR